MPSALQRGAMACPGDRAAAENADRLSVQQPRHPIAARMRVLVAHRARNVAAEREHAAPAPVSDTGAP